MTIMLYLYSKIFFERPMKDFFEKVKTFTAQKGYDVETCANIIIAA